MRDLTEKTRTLGDDEGSSASTGQLVNQENCEILKLKEKNLQRSRNRSLLQILFRHLLWIKFRFMKGNGLTSSRLRIACLKMLRAIFVSKRMVALLRHGTPREEDGAIEFGRLKEDLKSKFPNSVRWSLGMWIDHLQKGWRHKKTFQYCTKCTGSEILYL